MKSDKVAILAKKISLEFDKMSNPVLSEYNLTSAQYRILKYLLSHQKEKVRQADIEKFYSLTHPTTIGLLEQLEKKGFIQKRINPADARSRIITLTDQSLEMEEELEHIGEALEEKLTAVLTEEERLQLIELLHKLLSQFG